jgi:hypothetical protein
MPLPMTSLRFGAMADANAMGNKSRFMSLVPQPKQF